MKLLQNERVSTAKGAVFHTVDASQMKELLRPEQTQRQMKDY